MTLPVTLEYLPAFTPPSGAAPSLKCLANALSDGFVHRLALIPIKQPMSQHSHKS